MPTLHEDLVDDVVDACHQTAQQVMAAMTAPEWIELELSISQVKALFVLARQEPASVGDIGECLGVGVSAASHLVDRLVHEGLALRQEDPENRRRTLVCRTLRGRELINRLQQGRTELLRRLLSRMDDDDLLALQQGLQGMVKAVVRAHEEQAKSRGASSAG